MKTRTPFGPWTLSAATLLMLASMGPLMTGGHFDTILLGLPRTKLLIGTQPHEPQPAPVGAACPADRQVGTARPWPAEGHHIACVAVTARRGNTAIASG